MSEWPLRPIASVGTVITGSTPKTSEEHYYGGEIPFVTPAELDQFIPVTSAPRTLSKSGSQEVRLIPEGSVMVCCIGSLGKVGIAGRTVATNQQINSIIFDPGQIFPRYGFYACRRLKRRLEAMAPSTTVAIVSKSKFEQLEIPVPPLAEQRRIAEILDKADALRAKRRAALAQLDTLRQSIFLDMFGDPATNPKGWPVLSLSNCTARVQIGPFGSLLHQEDYVDGGIPLINPKHIQQGAIQPDASETVSARKFAELDAYHLRAGDVVMGRRGEMGRCAIVNENSGPLLCGTGSLFIRPDNVHTTSLFLLFLLSSAALKARLERLSLGQTLPNLNSQIVEGLEVPSPPLALQRDFAARVEAARSLTSAHREAASELNSLFASLQHRAFRGEL
jgi:type I restriction enzyme S subunit